jgi:hypothetical protein
MLGPDEVQRTDTVQKKKVTGPKYPFFDFVVADPARESYF